MTTELTQADFHNVLAVIDFGFKNGIVKSQDHAKLLLVLEQKFRTAVTPVEPTEEEDGSNDIPASD
jgi:hypothetical protein